MKDNLILDKSFEFAVSVVNLYKYLTAEKHEFVLSKQILRSGTSIGANVKEAVVAQSRKEFVAKMNISLKEANETEYWILLLGRTGYIDDANRLLEETRSIIRILTSIIKSTNDYTQT
jgi:four helix bundle protein